MATFSKSFLNLLWEQLNILIALTLFICNREWMNQIHQNVQLLGNGSNSASCHFMTIDGPVENPVEVIAFSGDDIIIYLFIHISVLPALDKDFVI